MNEMKQNPSHRFPFPGSIRSSIKKSVENCHKGLTLFECLLSLSLFLFIFTASMEFFGVSRNVFLKLSHDERQEEALSFAVDRIRIDLLESGRGLSTPIALGVINGLRENEEGMTLCSRQEDLSFSTDLIAGQERIVLGRSYNIRKGRDICICDSEKGEKKTVATASGNTIILSSPLDFSYAKKETSLFLLREISLFLDKNSCIVRRKVNASPSQPLLENVAAFDYHYDREANLVRIHLALKDKKEKNHEIHIFPKNMALAVPR